MMIDKPIYSKKVILRNIHASDANSQYVEWLKDKSINRYIDARFTDWNTDKVCNYVNYCLESENILLLAIVFESRHIGNLKIEISNSINKIISISILIGTKVFWGHGLGTDSILAATEYSFRTLKAEKIIANMYQENIGSLKAFTHVGFQLEGIFRDHCFLENNTRTNLLQVGYTRSDWSKNFHGKNNT